MALYAYHCKKCGAQVEIYHPMAAVNTVRHCECGAVLSRRLTPIHHRWPSQFYPGNEESGQRRLLDPEFQARKRDEFEQRKAARGEST